MAKVVKNSHTTAFSNLEILSEEYLVSFFAALLVKLDQLVLAWARLDSKVKAEKKYYQRTNHSEFT